MSAELIECVPNISEGRRCAVVDAIADAVAQAPGVALLDRASDADHNRSVLTLAGTAAGLLDAVRRLYAAALPRIDMREQSGEHPRIGAVDVVPFIPIEGAGMPRCVELARAAAAMIAHEFGVPIILYAEAAAAPRRRKLGDIRRGGFEGLAAKLREPQWHPDFGSEDPHPTLGASAFGARPFLIAYNLQLDTSDVGIAKAVARAVRAGSPGGLPHVQALGFYLSERGCAQVSMNLLDFDRTPVHVAQERVKQEAARFGARVTGAELVGLIPRAALAAAEMAGYDLQIEGFRPGMVLEEALSELPSLPGRG